MYEVHYWASQTRFFRPKKSPKSQYISRFAATAVEIYPNIPRFTSIFVYFCIFLSIFARFCIYFDVFICFCTPLLRRMYTPFAIFTPPLHISGKKKAGPPSLPSVYGVKLNNLIPLILTI